MKLADIRALCDAAHNGPWAATHIFDGEEVISAAAGYDGTWIGVVGSPRDAAFIAAARTLLPKLLAVAEAAKNPALTWNESYCTHNEGLERDQAWVALDAAVLELEYGDD